MNGKVYMLRSNDVYYIGSTTMSLTLRLQMHRANFKAFRSNKSSAYCSAYQLFEDSEPTIELIEDYPTDSKESLYKRERYWLEHYRSLNYTCVNQIKPFATDAEHRERQRIYAKTRYHTDPAHRERQKQQALARYHNDPEVREKARLKRKPLVMVTCECGKTVRRHNLALHLKTKLHERWLSKLTVEYQEQNAAQHPESPQKELICCEEATFPKTQQNSSSKCTPSPASDEDTLSLPVDPVMLCSQLTLVDQNAH